MKLLSNYKLAAVITGCFFTITVQAQDTTKKQTVEIISAFKPVLKNAMKQNFNATPPAPDNQSPKLTYDIPMRNLFFNLQPVAIKPLALQIDSTGDARKSNYVKLGYGNFNTPFAEAGLSLGDGKKTNFNLFADHLSHKGPLRAQRFSTTGFRAHLNTLVDQVEVYGKLGYQKQVYHLYGPDPALINTKEDSLRKPYQSYNIRVGARNAYVNKYNISYNPDLNITVFNDGRASESNATLDIPVEVRVSNHFNFGIRANASLTTFKPTGYDSYINNLFFLNPSLIAKYDKFRAKIGIRPTWDKGSVNVLPDVLVDFHIKQKEVIAVAGWTGYVQKNNYEYLVSINPWINQPLTQFNTRISEIYAGLKGTVAEKLNYRVQIGYSEYKNMPLFVNNLQPALFYIRKEDKMQAIHNQAELGIVVQDQLTAAIKLDWYNYFNQSTELQAWHMPPIQLNGSVKWRPSDKFLIHSDLFAWQGPLYLKDNAGTQDRLKAVFDLNAGAEFTVAKNVGVWLQVNNIFNNSYQRWNNYQQLGFQFLGGIKLTFAQNQ